MFAVEKELNIPARKDHNGLIEYFREAVGKGLRPDETAVRFVVTKSDDTLYNCELGIASGLKENSTNSIFEYRQRERENTDKFNAVFLVPTGIGAEIGGHAGDAAPVVRLLSTICDNLITHPNAVNASDINEIPGNGLYVEGSVICRLIMGTAGLQPVRSNRILSVIDEHNEPSFIRDAINSINASRASCGYNCVRIVVLDTPISMKSLYTISGRAAGRIEQLENLCGKLDEFRGEYDAVSLSSVIQVPIDFHSDYFTSDGSMVNPWGGVEAILTHTISELYGVPSAHAPMLESEDVCNIDLGVVDPRMAAEAVSITFMHCLLKGLHRSPQIIRDRDVIIRDSVISAEDVSCLVTPDGCIGLPVLAALEQGIPVIAVKENRNKMKNDLSVLPWNPGQLITVENYWEAAGVMNALKAGVEPKSVRRPMKKAPVTRNPEKKKEQPLISMPSVQKTESNN